LPHEKITERFEESLISDVELANVELIKKLKNSINEVGVLELQKVMVARGIKILTESLKD
jgi:hypothetical protein